MVITMIFKRLLVQYEIEHELSHEEMAELCGVSRATYFRWLAGSTKLRTRTKQNVGKVLGINNIDEVLEESEMNIPKWRSHLIRQNRATYSNLENHLIQITEPGNPI